MKEFKEGQEVFLYTHAGGMVKKTIRKEYKNGNFVLEGNGNEQFSSGGWGRGNYSRSYFVSVNEKTTKEHKFRLLRNLMARQAKRLGDHSFSEIDLELMEEISLFLNQKLAKRKPD